MCILICSANDNYSGLHSINNIYSNFKMMLCLFNSTKLHNFIFYQSRRLNSCLDSRSYFA